MKNAKMPYVVIGLVLIVGAALYFFYPKIAEKNQLMKISSYEDCIKVYPVLTSRPAQCKTPDNKTYYDLSNFTSFDQCQGAGFPIMESYPRQCKVPNGKTFVEEISDTTINVESGITGTVLLGPTCPVMRNPPDPQCADKPYQTNLVLTTEDGLGIIKTFSSDTQGKFTIAVFPGKYIIGSGAKAPVYPRCGSGVIEVKEGQYTKADVSCDTGIR